MKYFNPHALGQKRSFKDIILWKTGKYFDFSKKTIPPKNFVYPHESKFNLFHPYVVWINHSTFLIHINGITILTDPIWSDFCSPVKIVGKRKHAPGLCLDQIPKVDYVLISHNHYDHLDAQSIKKLHDRFPHIHWIVPQGIKKWFLQRKIHNVSELKWWASLKKKEIVFHAVPAQHFSGRIGIDYNQTLWCGFVVEVGQKKLYFCGDTAYNLYDFKEIGQKFAPLDLSLIPIGAYEPRRFMKPIHISPEEAVKIHQEIGSKFSIGMHWKTFRLSDEKQNQPPYDLFLSMKTAHLNPKKFIVLNPGEYVNW